MEHLIELAKSYFKKIATRKLLAGEIKSSSFPPRNPLREFVTL